MTGVIRIVHPFPSTLDAVATTALVLIAGGPAAVAVQLGVAMLALQAAIGTTNDLIDEPLDRGRKLGKPLPRGLLSRRTAKSLVAIALIVGLVLSALSGPPVLAVAVMVVSVGLIYDVWLKGTVWSWLPLALGIPLLPVYSWLGATGTLPSAFAVLVPTGVIAGAALALANVLADLERDIEADTVTAATRLGALRAWVVNMVLQAIVVVVALGSLAATGGRGAGIAVAAFGVLLIAAGVAFGLGRQAGTRERAWECQAVGVGLLAVGWVAALVEAGAL